MLQCCLRFCVVRRPVAEKPREKEMKENQGRLVFSRLKSVDEIISYWHCVHN